MLRGAEKLNRASQRLIAGRDALAREFDEADISRPFKANGNIKPASSEYAVHLPATLLIGGWWWTGWLRIR